MKLQANQRLNIVTRALIFHQGHLLVTQWRDDYAFLIGGKVEHGESLHEAVLREVREETGVSGHIVKLCYFAENFFETDNIAWHEYGWYFWVELDALPCPLDTVIPNPDHPDLIIRWVPVAQVPDMDIYPLLLKQYVATDYDNGFADTPRHIIDDQRVDPPSTQQVDIGPLPA